MTPTTLCNQIKIANNETLKLAYETCCEEYRRRLCEQWDLWYEDTWWIPSDRIGETLALQDLEYSLSMSDVIMFVNKGISFKDFEEWWNYNYNRTLEDDVNAYSWFEKGYRPKDYGKEIQDK